MDRNSKPSLPCTHEREYTRHALKVAHEFEELDGFSLPASQAPVLSRGPLSWSWRLETTVRACLWTRNCGEAGEKTSQVSSVTARKNSTRWYASTLSGGNGAKKVVYHEYAHTILHMNSRWLPVWLDEGTAEFYAYTRFDRDRILSRASSAFRTTLASGVRCSGSSARRNSSSSVLLWYCPARF